MNCKRLLAAAAIPAAIAATATTTTTARAQTTPAIQWQPATAIAFGSGCSSLAGDTVFIAFGNDAAVLFSRLGVDLPAGGPATGLADLKNCSVRIPATIRKGFYLSELVQTITYGVNKSVNTTGMITSLSTFFNLPVASFSVPIGPGSINNPSVTASKRTPFLVNAACGGVDLAGLYRSDLAVSGRRSTVNETLIMSTQGLDLRYSITAVGILCPFS